MTSEIGPAGHWICQTCGFQLTTAILRASDGAVGVNRRPVEDICPNDGTSMRPVTWEEDAADANRVALEQMKRADELEALLLQRAQEIADLTAENRRLLSDWREQDQQLQDICGLCNSDEFVRCGADVIEAVRETITDYQTRLTEAEAHLTARAQEIEQVKAGVLALPVSTMTVYENFLHGPGRTIRTVNLESVLALLTADAALVSRAPSEP